MLIYINNFSDNMGLSPKLFANDTFLLSVVKDIDSSASNSNSDFDIFK